jgi:ATP-dependent Clp protease ATP-binding subunit ClpC
MVSRKTSSLSSSSSRAVRHISVQRRQVARWMKLERVQQVRSELEFLLTQLSYGNKNSSDKRSSAEIAELQANHHFLDEIWRRLERHRDELEAAEELALTALFASESTVSMAAEAEVQFTAFTRALPYALLAMDGYRDSILLSAQELNAQGGLEVWLIPLLGEAAARGWSINIHFENGERGPDDNWPPLLRWGPPRGSDRAVDLIRKSANTQAVIVRVTGAFAGVLLALEAGLHRWAQSDEKPQPELFVRTLTLRPKLRDTDWTDPTSQPLAPNAAEIATKSPVVRSWPAATNGIEICGGAVKLSGITAETYWTDFNEIAAHHLLYLEDHDRLRETTLTGELDRVVNEGDDLDDEIPF